MVAQLNPEIVIWAASRCGLSEADLERKFPKYEKWIDDTRKPTIRQLNDLARLLHVRLFELFSDARPDYTLQIADFRTVDDMRSKDPSPELYDTVDMMLVRQLWMKEYFQAEGYGQVELVGSFIDCPATKETVVELAKYMHELLNLSSDWASNCKTVEDALRTLKNSIESLGISIAVNGVVGDNNHRTLNVEEFRGFVLADRIAPVIFVNGRDTKTAQIFTLVHELCHLAYAQSGVSNTPDDQDTDIVIEQFCNKVAAEFLVPKVFIVDAWLNGEQNSFAKIQKIVMTCKVNFVVAARKACEEGLISNEEYCALFDRYKKELSTLKMKVGNGGDFYRSKQYKLGNVFADAVRAAVNTNYLDYRDAYEMTGMKAPTFKKYFEKVG